MKQIATGLALVLGTRRLVTLVLDDTITEPIRQAVWKRYPPHSSKIGYLFTCRNCSSVWAAAIMLLLSHGQLPGKFLLHSMALSEAALVTDKLVDKYATPPTMFN